MPEILAAAIQMAAAMPRGGMEDAMFTSMELDDDLFHQAWALSGERTKKGFVEELLRVYVRLHEQAQVRELRGKLVWKEDLNALRGGGGRRANRR